MRLLQALPWNLLLFSVLLHVTIIRVYFTMTDFTLLGIDIVDFSISFKNKFLKLHAAQEERKRAGNKMLHLLQELSKLSEAVFQSHDVPLNMKDVVLDMRASLDKLLVDQKYAHYRMN